MDNFWYVFGVFGIIVAGIICVIAVVWLTCFAVRILTKTFGTTVKNFNQVEKENIEKKFIAKKERLAKKREQQIAHKNEMLALKMEKTEQIHKIKMQKLEQKLNDKVKLTALKNEVTVDVETKYECYKNQDNEIQEVETKKENIEDNNSIELENTEE